MNQELKQRFHEAHYAITHVFATPQATDSDIRHALTKLKDSIDLYLEAIREKDND